MAVVVVFPSARNQFEDVVILLFILSLHALVKKSLSLHGEHLLPMRHDVLKRYTTTTNDSLFY